MLAVSYPGVFIEENNAPALTISTGATAVPLFVGVFKDLTGTRYPLLPDAGELVRITDWLDFTSRFLPSSDFEFADVTWVSGPSISEAKVDYTPHLGSLSVQHYFSNGGGPCYLCSYESGENNFTGLSSIIKKYPEITLFCFCENDPVVQVPAETELATLLQADKYLGYFYIADAYKPTGQDIVVPLTDVTQTAVYYPALETTYTQSLPTDDIIFIDTTGNGQGVPNGRYSLEELATSGNGALNTVYEQLVDTSQSIIKDTDDVNCAGVHAAMQSSIDLVYPPDNPAVKLKASPAMAGVYATMDRDRGVWKAPANVAPRNVTGLYIEGDEIPDDDSTGGLLANRINAIKEFSRFGILVWGARTMIDPLDPNLSPWLYIPVRRLFNAAERDIKKSMEYMVFEPNNQITWELVRSSIVNYLDDIWRSGGLAGTTAEAAYFVNIGKGTTMTDDDINSGKMIVKVGMAPVRPAEFIILQFTQDIMPAT